MKADDIPVAHTPPAAARPSNPRRHVERIEQCGDRVCITSSGIIHDMRADGTAEHGVNDVAADGREISVVCTFEDGCTRCARSACPASR